MFLGGLRLGGAHEWRWGELEVEACHCGAVGLPGGMLRCSEGDLLVLLDLLVRFCRCSALLWGWHASSLALHGAAG